MIWAFFVHHIPCTHTRTSSSSTQPIQPASIYPIIRITIYAHPSPYAEHLATSSIGADIGTTAPCSTGLARTGILRLGNRCGRSECRAVPMVCGCAVVVESPLPDVDVGSEGESGDCTSFNEGAPESGGRGRKKRMGTLRNGWLGGGRRMLEIRWKEGRSTVTISD